MAQAHRCAYQRKGLKSYAFRVDLEQSVAEVETGRRRPASARLVGRQRRYSSPLLWDLPSGDTAELTQFGGRNGQLLEMTFLVQLLRPLSGNLGQRSIRTPKVYLNDTGLLAHLLALSQERLETDPSLAGALAENFVMMELVKQSAWSETTPKIFYWRTASGREVDVVLEDSAGRLWVMK
jgi:hypothetical protein